MDFGGLSSAWQLLGRKYQITNYLALLVCKVAMSFVTEEYRGFLLHSSDLYPVILVRKLTRLKAPFQFMYILKSYGKRVHD